MKATNINLNLKNTLSAQEIFQKLVLLTRSERKILAEIISYLQIISDQKLFLDFKRSSLLEFCIKDLGYSESAAIRRIKVLKLVRSVPAAMDSLRDGSLSLSQAADAQSLFEKQSQEKRQVLLPEKKLALITEIKGKGARDSENHLRQALSLPKKARKVVIDTEEETFKKWIEFKGRMINKNWSDEKLLNHLLEAEKSLFNESCRQAALATNAQPSKNKNQRTISASIRRDLFAANSHCQWPGCTSVYGLEIDHIRPISANGQSVTENLRLLCKNHNQKRNLI